MISEDKYIEDIDVHGTAADMWEFSLKGCEIDSKLSLDEVMKNHRTKQRLSYCSCKTI